MSKEKVLVCITIQENSVRLMDKGAQICRCLNGELHIVHFEKGNTLFSNEQATQLAESLYNHGSSIGGQVHLISGQEIAKDIVNFIENNGITRVVLGESMRSPLHQMLKGSIHSFIRNQEKAYDVLVLEREEQQKNRRKVLPNEFAF